MNVLHVSPVFYPATYWGGPIFSMLGLCNSLSRLPDVTLRVLATDSSGPKSSDRLSTEEIETANLSGYEVFFCRKDLGAEISIDFLRKLGAMLRWADIVHLEGVYSFPTFPTLYLCRTIRKPLVWSTRGALLRWERSTKRTAKSLWESACNRLLDPKCSVIHVTSEEENAQTQRRIHRARVITIPNGVIVPDAPDTRPPRTDGILRIIFLGRLHPIKGIENLLHALSRTNSIPWELRLCGSGDPKYGRQLRDLAVSLGIGANVAFVGQVGEIAKFDEFMRADIAVVPSFSENFGMSIAEALAHGVPVIASTGTPWKSIGRAGAGLWVDNDSESLACAITRIAAMNVREMGARGRAWMKEEFDWASVATRMKSVYSELEGAETQ